MRRRVLTFLLAGLVVLGSVLSCVPMRASAVVPLGFVQSALASYVASAGYKLWNDNGTGQEILKSLSDLYDGPFLAFAESSLGVNIKVNDLSYYAANDMVYQDNSGQIVIRKAAADMFQEFANWIQSQYNVTVGSDTPTSIVTGESSWTDGNGVVAGNYVTDTAVSGMSGWYRNTEVVGVDYAGNDLYFCTVGTGSLYATQYQQNGGSQVAAYVLNASTYQRTMLIYLEANGRFGGYLQSNYSETSQWVSFNFTTSDVTFSLPVSTVVPSTTVLEEGAVVGLGVTLAQAVADVIGQAKEDDAVVIGVGASAGATAQDIADMVAQGVKAQTLEPSVSITAESVIDTPVQPYPDIDGLGLPELGAALVSRFPFCIPWDFVDTVKLLNAEPVAPDIAVDLFPAAFKSKVGVTGSTEFRINLGDEKYQKIGTFCRWGSLIGFCFGLAVLTKRMIWTA